MYLPLFYFPLFFHSACDFLAIYENIFPYLLCNRYCAKCWGYKHMNDFSAFSNGLGWKERQKYIHTYYRLQVDKCLLRFPFDLNDCFI